MRKTTVITGPAGSGKSERARALASGKKTAVIEAGNMQNRFLLAMVEDGTQVLILEGVVFNPGALEAIKDMATSDTLIINTRYKDYRMIPMPELIVTCQATQQNLLAIKKFNPRRFEIERLRLIPQEPTVIKTPV